MPKGKPGFIGQLIKDKDVAAISPSSHYLIRRLLRCLRPERAKTVVEFGPGPGIVTLPLLRRLAPDARYVAIEKNPEFVESLKIIGDKRLEVVEGDARDAKSILAERGLSLANVIIASIPFTYLSKEERLAVVETAYDLLDDDGDFVVFHQYTPLMMPYLKKFFPYVKQQFEPLNVFPCFLFHCRKKK